MGKGAPLRWLENRYLQRHLEGVGVEIGGLWRRSPVHAESKVIYLDRADVDVLEEEHSDLQAPVFRPDVIADAATLPIKSSSVDFVVASHGG